MKYRQYFIYLIALVFAGLFSCANPASTTNAEYTVTITGTAVNLLGTKLDSVHVILWSPSFVQDTASASGAFTISFSAQDKTTITDSITLSRSGFLSTTIHFIYSSTANVISLSAVVLKGVTGTQDSLTTLPPSQRAGQIVFIGSSASTLSILGAGGPDATILTFEVRDSLGVPVDTSNRATVNFRFISQPDAQTQLNLDSVHTNSAGQALVQLSAGLKSGLALVQASAGVKSKSDPTKFDTITSQIVSIPIYGGFPDSAHFSIGGTLYNIPGAVLSGFHDKIAVQIGDKYGNPVHLGTPVIFSTTGGLIEGSKTTDPDGSATVDLITGSPVPPNGYVTVTAQVATSQGGVAGGSNTPTSLKSGTAIADVETKRALIPKPLANHLTKLKPTKVLTGPVLTDSVHILFSGKTTMSSPSNGFIIPVGSSAQVTYTVSDTNGNPLTSGTTIQVTASGPATTSVALTGDVVVTIPDTQDKKFTQFQVSLKDIRTTGLNLSQALTLTIAVTSQNGNNKLILSGNLSGTGGVTVDSSIVSRIVLQNPSPDSILVAGLGGTNFDAVKFKVYNTFGLPAKNVLVTFKLPLQLNGGEYLSPQTSLTDTGGNVSTTLTSGTKYGEVHVTASTTKDSLTLTSDPKVIYIVIPPSARLASQVLYLGASATDIYVDGVGALENSTISYQVTDSLGIPIDRQRRVGVTYVVQFFPNSTTAGGTPPSVIPSTDSTDDNGRLHTSVVSGTEAGVIQIVAHIAVPGRATLLSQPVKVTVHAGFADQAHFTLLPSQYVFAGWNSSIPALTIPFGVAVGDTFSNPVAQGTAVYFHTQAGVVQTGNGAYTDLSGLATVNLFLVNPTPFPLGNPASNYKPVSGPYAAAIGGRDGYFWVYAQTQGHNLTNVEDSVLVVGDVGPIIVTGVPDTVVPLSPATHVSPPISITIKDGNGNPLPNGTTISASILPPSNAPSGYSVGVSGAISTAATATLPNAAFARFPGPNLTDFTFQVVNQSAPPAIAAGTTVTVNITVFAPNIGTLIFSFNAAVE